MGDHRIQASGRAFAYQEQGPRLHLRTRKQGEKIKLKLGLWGLLFQGESVG